MFFTRLSASDRHLSSGLRVNQLDRPEKVVPAVSVASESASALGNRLCVPFQGEKRNYNGSTLPLVPASFSMGLIVRGTMETTELLLRRLDKPDKGGLVRPTGSLLPWPSGRRRGNNQGASIVHIRDLNATEVGLC